jgi:hypothetical protein
MQLSRVNGARKASRKTKGKNMKLTARNLVIGNSTICFVVWSRQGSGMVNVYSPGDSGGETMSLEDARNYWREMIAKHGYSRAEDSIAEPC